jgi:hypothetical protein
VARTLGGALRKARTSWHALKRTIESELSAAEAANPLQGVREDVDSLRQQVRDLGQEVERAVEAPAPESSSQSTAESTAQSATRVPANADSEPKAPLQTDPKNRNDGRDGSPPEMRDD